MTRFNELSVGDVIRPRRSTAFYEVTGFHERSDAGIVDVQLSPKAGGAQTKRTMHQLCKNWRLVNCARQEQQETK